MSAHFHGSVSFAEEGDRCFRCGKPVSPSHVEWHGWSRKPEFETHGLALVVLHPACAAHLALHLASDALKAQPGVLYVRSCRDELGRARPDAPAPAPASTPTPAQDVT